MSSCITAATAGGWGLTWAGGSLLKPRVLGPVPPATVPAEPAVALVLGTSSLSRAGYDEGWKALSVPLTCAHV